MSTRRPASTDELSAILAEASASATPVIVVGGGTGLAGATEPDAGEIVISTDHLTQLGAVDPVTAQVTAGAGVTLASLNRHAREAGFEFPLDLGARDSATVGGMAGTNAGGALAWRFGSMRQLVAGVEAVLADGSVIGSLTGLSKDNAGYSLTGLLVGSEGTLAAISALRLSLVPRMDSRATALVKTATIADAVALMAHLRSNCPDLIACDFVHSRALRLSADRIAVRPPLPSEDGWFAVVELGAPSGDLLPQLTSALESANGIVATAIAADSDQRAAIWKVRDALTEACDATGNEHKLDIAVPVNRLAELETAIRAAIQSAGGSQNDAMIWGHLADGNVHLAPLFGLAGDDQLELKILEAVSELEGSIAAEHGVGRDRLELIGLSRSDAELKAMAAIRKALDPNGILASGRAVPR